jgi:Ca-activated chloride channel family protein
VGEPITMQSSGRDLLLAVDISGSMEEQDMVIDDRTVRRIDAVKAVLNEFIDRRTGDRLGLVLFGSQAYLQAPLSFDRETIKQLLNEAELGFAGKQTAIGDAIGLAVKRLQARPADERVMILLTDGANTAGEVQPLQAAQLAAELDVKIYTIGMGADSMVVPGIFGSSFGARTVNPSRDLDEPTLQSIAQQTGGRYFRARDVDELQRIYAEVDALEPTPDDGVTYRPQQAYFFWPLGLAWGLSLLLAVTMMWGKRR